MQIYAVIVKYRFNPDNDMVNHVVGSFSTEELANCAIKEYTETDRAKALISQGRLAFSVGVLELDDPTNVKIWTDLIVGWHCESD